MNTTETELKPGFRRSRMTTIKGLRTSSVVTFNPTTISPAKRLQVKVAGETAYDCLGESLFEVFKDLWLTLGDRKKMTEQGLISKNIRKLISGDDSGVKVGDVADEIMTAQGGEQVDGYKLDNLELEYETIENDTLASEVSRMYSTGRSLSYKHVTLMRTSKWDKDLTIVNENINIPRKSMSAIVLLFTNRVRTDSEEYIYPKIDKVNVTIEGVPNAVFSQGLPKNRFFEEAKRFFCPSCEKSMADEFMSISKLFSNGFALVIDLRSTQDDTTGGGKKIVNTQSGVLLEIKKRATTADVQCNIFVVSDALLNFANRDLSSIQY
ncbi:Hypothetical predicted protein [Paramuricea clavata]|uniref:Uncharacterized protein n=1 Tax=Paramuricea clavata TaxID=317549 RepID=A0A7D9I4A7_PARCT|nr:Hypothetical predicted protein [Paramuricea clavata]